jgi:hypothetical protein
MFGTSQLHAQLSRTKNEVVDPQVDRAAAFAA